MEMALWETRQPRKRRRIVWDVAPFEISQENCPVFVNDELERYVTPPRRDDDREGHYVYSLGENLTPRYKILRKMGEGTFGQVLECVDQQTQEHVAIKVVRSNSRYRGAAMIEIDMLRRLGEHDKIGSQQETRLNWPEGAESRESTRAVQKLEHVKDLISRHVDGSKSLLIDLLYKLLRFDPSERLCAKEALKHPFFKSST